MIPKFSFYDLIAAVIPGILMIWGISLTLDSIYIPLKGDLAETSVLIALAYVSGLILQGISQGLTEKILLKIWGGFPSARWLLSDNSYFSHDYKNKIRSIVEEKYGIKTSESGTIKEQIRRNQEIFYLCYNAVDKEKLSDRPQIFNAHYGLFRALLTSFCLLLLFDSAILIIGGRQEKAVLYAILIFSFIGAGMSYLRTKKRGEDFARSIYDLFFVQFSK